MYPFLFKTQLKEAKGAKELKEINWLPTTERVEKCITTKVFEYWKELHHSKFLTPLEICLKVGHIWLWR